MDERISTRLFIIATVVETVVALGCWELGDILATNNFHIASGFSFWISLSSLPVYAGIVIYPRWPRLWAIIAICVVTSVTYGLLIYFISGGDVASFLS